MREIKFRAWCEETKKMHYDIQEAYDDTDDLPEDSFGLFLGKDNQYRTPRHKYQVMQFTGLLGKNGKEIYEGDIVRIKIESPASDHPELADDFVCDVRWEKERMGWVAYRFGEMRDYFECEVIGNIYENPELLK